MTEQEWLTCADPGKMLHELRAGFSHMAGDPPLPRVMGTASDRKLRLLACAWCRLVWNHLPDEWSRECVDVAEKFADNLATAAELERCRQVTWMPPGERAGWGCTLSNPYRGCQEILIEKIGNPQIQADLLRCLFGNPFHLQPPVWLECGACSYPRLPGEPCERCNDTGRVRSQHYKQVQTRECERCFGSGRARGAYLPECDCPTCDGTGQEIVAVLTDPITPTVLAVAERIYEERAFDQLGVLADALEEGGCDNANMIGHLRLPGPHARGCWVIDLLLGKS